MESDRDTLSRLNHESFKAEDDCSGESLAKILSDDFRIVRSDWTFENKRQAVAFATAGTPGRKRLVCDELIHQYDNAAIVTCRVAVTEPDGRQTGQYWNTKVFVKREGRWQCIAWQVAAIP